MALKPYQQRVVDEQRELRDKIAKLQKHLASTAFKEHDPVDQALLQQQLGAMDLYSTALQARIARFGQ